MDYKTAFDLAVSSLKYLYEYYTLWRDCPDDVTKVRTSLEWLLTIFIQLGETIEKPHLEHDIVEAITTVKTACESKIIELKDVLNKVIKEDPQGGFIERFKAGARRASYPFRRSTIARLEEIIDDLKGDLSQATGLLTLNTLVDFEKNLGSKLDRIIMDQERDRILIWLGQSSIYDLALKKREPGTGNWFLGDHFKSWRESDSSFLWLNGSAGCGKTVLCSSIIEKVKLTNGANDHLAYFYFSLSNPREQHRDQHQDFLTSAISQLNPEHGVSDKLRKLHKEQKRGVTDLRTTFVSLLKELGQTTPGDENGVTNHGNTFIIMDALNLVPSGDQRNEILNLLKEIYTLTVKNLHVLATSRVESDIETALAPWKSLLIDDDLMKDDIRLYVANHIAKNEHLRAQKENIESRLIERAKGLGMFQRAALQIQYLETLQLQVMRPMDFDKVFNEELPRILNSPYEGILAKIDTHFTQEVLTALQWLAFSRGPLYVEEVAEACIISQQGATHVEEKRRFPYPSAIFDILSGLAIVFPPLPPPKARKELPKTIFTLDLAHSVKEYLVGDQISSSDAQQYSIKEMSAQCFLAESCLDYISYYTDKQSDPDPKAAIPDEDMEQFPLLHYACQFWIFHAQKIPVGSLEPITHVADFLQSSGLLTWVRFYHTSIPKGPDVDFSISSSVVRSPLYYASHFGLEGVVKLLLHRKPDSDAWAALGTAAARGHQGTVELLLDHKAKIEAGDRDEWRKMRNAALELNDGLTALRVAGEQGRMAIVLLLLNAILPPHLGVGSNATEECAICIGDSTDNFRFLLCKHSFHDGCLRDMKQPNCPYCFLDILRDPKMESVVFQSAAA